jgi:hypothetical protein
MGRQRSQTSIDLRMDRRLDARRDFSGPSTIAVMLPVILSASMR